MSINVIRAQIIFLTENTKTSSAAAHGIDHSIDEVETSLTTTTVNLDTEYTERHTMVSGVGWGGKDGYK